MSYSYFHLKPQPTIISVTPLTKIGRKLVGEHEASSPLIHDRIAIITGCKH